MTDISKEYAAALFALARESGQERAFSAALALIDRQLTAQPEYAALLSSPNVPLKERLGLLEEAFGAQVPEYVLSFTQLLCEKGHIRQFSACVQEYEALVRALSDVSASWLLVTQRNVLNFLSRSVVKFVLAAAAVLIALVAVLHFGGRSRRYGKRSRRSAAASSGYRGRR